MAVELRPATALLVLVAVLAAGSIGSVFVAETAADGDEFDGETIDLGSESDDRLWLYTSRERAFDQRTLAINVVVYGSPERVRRQLLRAGRGDWNETADDEQDIAPAESPEAVNATAVEWQRADGADRYVFLVTPDGGGKWLAESYQLHDGDYLGSRHHVRAYRPPERDPGWTAMQAHHEYWDWFTVRHVVTSVEESQAYVEGEFITRPGTGEVVRVHVGGGDAADFDGWLTVVDLRKNPLWALVTGVLLLGATGTRRPDLPSFEDLVPEREVRALALAGGIVTLFLSVRLSAILLERSLSLPARPIAIALYPLIFAGIPITTYLLARQLNRPWAFSGASLGFLTAVLLDYTYLGVTHIPLDVLVHRGALAVALGLIAVGGSHVERRNAETPSHVQSGVLLWLVAMVLPLLRFTPLPV